MAAIKKAKEAEVQIESMIEDRKKAIIKGQLDWEDRHRKRLSSLKIQDWELVDPVRAKAKGQTLTVESTGAGEG